MELFRKYLPTETEAINEVEPNWGVNVLTVGHYIHPMKKHYPDVKHPSNYYFNWENGRILEEFQLLYISNGSGIFESDAVPPTHVEAGTAFLLFPNVWHRYKPSEESGWEEFWVGFSGDYAEFLMSQDCFSASTPLISIGFNAELMNVFNRLIDTIRYEGVAFKQLSSCLVIQLLGLIYASALMKDDQNSNKKKIIRHFRYKIQENWANDINLEDLAKEMNVGYVWFRKAFKEVLGISPRQYHLKLKIEKASQMLLETSLSVSEIAYKTGFESEFYFSKIFKKKTNFSPNSFRKMKNT